MFDDLVCRGAADDVFHADQARALLEELDRYVEKVSETGMGIVFFAHLQGILQRELILSMTRLFEPYSAQNPGRSLPSIARHIRVHAPDLRIPERRALIDFVVKQKRSRPATEVLSDEPLSRAFVLHLEALPRADATSARPVDRALEQLRTTRNKAIAHHDHIDRATLLVPAWPHLVELINFARESVEVIARAYLSVGLNLAYDGRMAAMSLRQVMDRAGLGG